MPLYEYRTNAENHVSVPETVAATFVQGTTAVADALITAVAGRARSAGAALGLEAWYAVDRTAIATALAAAAQQAGLRAVCIDSACLFRPAADIAAYQQPHVGQDPSFGVVNDAGTLADIIAPAAVADLASRLSATTAGEVLIVIGPGACIDELFGKYAATAYLDFTMQPLLWTMWGGGLVPFGSTTADPGYHWKRYYYNDFYLLYRQKKALLPRIGFYIEAVDAANLKLLPGAAYQTVIDATVSQPIKQVKILQPGPWGAYRYKDLWQVDGLECNAWNELAGIELSVLIDLGQGRVLNVPTQNLMQRPRQMVGELVSQRYPDLLPLQVWLDDGLFPEPVPFERSSMPIHNHPDSAYVKRNFNEPLGRYETYYIVESYPGSSTWMGYREGADLEEWERRIRASNNLTPIPDWQDFICRWDTTVGDLFLIPPGTAHGHGGNQMILEMDTGPSVAGTEYSFFAFDFARPTWDDQRKTMTAKPMRMHLDHAVANERWIREERVRRNHRARPVTVAGNGRFRKDRYTTLPEMPFHIERFFFEESAEHDTEGRFVQIATLTEGERVVIESIDHPGRCTTIERLQACIIPAGFGRHRYRNLSGRHALVVLIRLKEG
jgi:hypothetical protein